MRNQENEIHTTGGHKSQDGDMNKTGTSSIFNKTGSLEHSVEKVDKKKGKTAAFKAVTRGELDRIKGTRPLYE
jgi:hypothetical protein